jgi:hypothetical protein
VRPHAEASEIKRDLRYVGGVANLFDLRQTSAEDLVDQAACTHFSHHDITYTHTHEIEIEIRDRIDR